MARIILNESISEIKGSIDGVTFQHNASGYIARSKPNRKVNPSTPQTVVNIAYQKIVNRWHFLTANQKTGWNSLAAAHMHISPWDDSKRINGFQQFVSNNLNLQVCDVAIIDDAPAYIIPDAVPPFTFELTDSQILLKFAAPFFPAPYFFAVYATPPIRSIFANNRKGNFLLPAGQWLDSTTYDITSQYCALFNIDLPASISSIICSLITRCFLIDRITGFRSPGTYFVAELPAEEIYYELSVINGTGSGSYLPGTIVPIVANEPPAGQIFVCWAGDTAFIDDFMAPSTFITMPAMAQTVFPVFIDSPTPDPAVICPAAGYVLNPISEADGWSVLCQFQNNSPYNAQFDPSILASSGKYAWVLGDGTIQMFDKYISHTYDTTATRSVMFYGKGACVITTIDFNSDNILDTLDLSNDAFKSLTNIILHSNLLMTNVVFPALSSGIVSNIQIYNSGIIGNFDFSMFATFTNGLYLNLALNPAMTGVTFANAITGTLVDIRIYSTGIIGLFDISQFSAFSNAAIIYLHSNPAMTGITFANAITGTIAALYIHTTGIIGILDISKFTSFSASAQILLYSNPSMSSITFANAITGTIASLYIYSTGIIGNLDLSKFPTFTTSASIQLYANTAMTGITFANAITGTIASLYIYSTGIIGNLDLSKFPTFTTSASIQLQYNPTVSGITFANAITGTIASLYIYITGIIGNFDLSKFTTFSASAQILLHSNPAMTGITFANAITGTISSLQIFSTGITENLDLSKFTTFSNSTQILLHTNPAMTVITFASSITGKLRYLYFNSCSLGYVNLLGFATGTAIANCDIQFQNNAMSAAIINHMLIDLNSISVSGFTGRKIICNGTNAAPDTTSGGYNGTAAKAALIAKGFTVTTN